MAALCHMIWITVAMAALVQHTDGTYTLMIKLMKYNNPGNLDWSGGCCDSIFSAFGCGSLLCDHVITFCLDKYTEAPNDHMRNNMFHCTEYPHMSTGRMNEATTNDLYKYSRIGNVDNPIIIRKKSWPGSIVFKAYIEDHDSWKQGDKYEDVDKIVSTLTPHLYTSVQSAPYSSTKALSGTRRGTKSNLEIKWKLFCNDNYFGPRCDVFCSGQDNDMTGHYTCDPNTGDKVCLTGWEEPLIACRIPADDCAAQNCNNGTCIDGIRTHTCKCPPGITGASCDTDIDECANSPCDADNTLICINIQSSYACRCKDGYVGAACAYHVCSQITSCKNGATCVGGGECLCAPGYTGTFCQTNICDDTVCQNGGHCNHGICYCPRSYTGQYCEIPVDLCAEVVCVNGVCKEGVCINPCNVRPCKNNGTCFFSLDASSYHCSCLPKFTGQTCSTRVQIQDPADPTVDDTCKDVVCYNDGACENGMCQCQPGYTGSDCMGIINHCVGVTCMNGGTCFSNPERYVCVCRSGYDGIHCENAVDASSCLSVQCLNKGRCESGKCLCTAGFTGMNCENTGGCNITPCMNNGRCYRSDTSYVCVCVEDWVGPSCEQKQGRVVSETDSPTLIAPVESPIGYWVYIVIGVGILFVLLIILVVSLIFVRRRRKQRQKSANSATKSNNTNDAFDNPAFQPQQTGVYENVHDDMPNRNDNTYALDRSENNHRADNDINLNIVPRDKNVYSKHLPPKSGQRPPVVDRSQSYDGAQAQRDVSQTSSGRRGSAPSTADSSDIYNATAGTASGYTYAKAKKGSTKNRELKTPKHLEERYQSMKAATLQNSLKK